MPTSSIKLTLQRITFTVLFVSILLLISSCSKIENNNKVKSVILPQSTYSIISESQDKNKLINDFMLAIDSTAIAGIYETDYGLKFDYVYDEGSLKEFQEGYLSIMVQMDKTNERINATTEPSILKDFKADLIGLLTQKIKLLKNQMKAIEKGGKWHLKFNHGSDVNLIMALEHYGNNEELIKDIQDYNLSAREFIKKYGMDVQKYEFGDEKVIFFIY